MLNTPSTHHRKHVSKAREYKHLSTQTRQTRKHVSTQARQARQARKHASTPSTPARKHANTPSTCERKRVNMQSTRTHKHAKHAIKQTLLEIRNSICCKRKGHCWQNVFWKINKHIFNSINRGRGQKLGAVVAKNSSDRFLLLIRWNVFLILRCVFINR